MAIGPIVAAAIAAIGALKKNDDDKRARQEAINNAEQQMWDQRNAEVQARIDMANGVDPRRREFANRLDKFHKAVEAEPFQYNWMPLVQAAGSALGSIDFRGGGEAKAPTGQDVPGKNFSPAENYTPPVKFADWQPVGTGDTESNYYSNAAKRFEENDKNSLPEWLR